MKAIKLMMVSMIVPLLIVGLWDNIPFVKVAVHNILDPLFGSLLDWDYLYGMGVIVFFITLLSVLLQKYCTDQVALKKIREEQKFLQEEMKKYREHPEKVMELNKKQMEIIPKTFEITLKPVIYTAIPFVLFMRWFGDYFANVQYNFFGFINWIWFYLILSIVFSGILRKILKVY
jgi:uncharacterized membrane protein (DUF106 family)